MITSGSLRCLPGLLGLTIVLLLAASGHGVPVGLGDACTATLSPPADTTQALVGLLGAWQSQGLSAGTVCLTPGEYNFFGYVSGQNLSVSVTIVGSGWSTMLSGQYGGLFTNFGELAMKNLAVTNCLYGISGSFRHLSLDTVLLQNAGLALSARADEFLMNNCTVMASGGFPAPAVSWSGGAALISDSVFNFNSAGGANPGFTPSALQLSGASASVSGCNFTSNSANGGVAALYARVAAMSVFNSTFETNHGGAGCAVLGGALAFSGSNLTIDWSIFRGNQCCGGGCAISGGFGPSTLRVQATTFSGNAVTSLCHNPNPVNAGAIVWVNRDSVFLSPDVVFEGNTPNDIAFWQTK
jgi:hypothetical protein